MESTINRRQYIPALKIAYEIVSSVELSISDFSDLLLP